MVKIRPKNDYLRQLNFGIVFDHWVINNWGRLVLTASRIEK